MAKKSREVIALEEKIRILNVEIENKLEQLDIEKSYIEGLKNEVMGYEGALKIITERPKRIRKPKISTGT